MSVTMPTRDEKIIRTIHKTDSITIVKDLLADSPPMQTSNEITDSQEDLSIRPPSSSISIGGGTSSGESTPEPTLSKRNSSGLLSPPAMDSAYGLKRGPSPPPVVFVTPSALTRQDIERRREQAKEGDRSVQEHLLHVFGPLRVPDGHFGKAKRLIRKENMTDIKVADDLLLAFASGLPTSSAHDDAPRDQDAVDVTDGSSGNDVSRAASKRDNTELQTDAEVGTLNVQPQMELENREHFPRDTAENDMEDGVAFKADSHESDFEEKIEEELRAIGIGNDSVNVNDDMVDKETNNNDIDESDTSKTVKFHDGSYGDDCDEEQVKMRKTPFRSPEPDDYFSGSDDDDHDDDDCNDDERAAEESDNDENNNALSEDYDDGDRSVENIKMIEELDEDEGDTADADRSKLPKNNIEKTDPRDSQNRGDGNSTHGLQNGIRSEFEENENINPGHEDKMKRSGSAGSHHSDSTEHEYESESDGDGRDSMDRSRSSSRSDEYSDSVSDVSLDGHLQNSAADTVHYTEQEEESAPYQTSNGINSIMNSIEIAKPKASLVVPPAVSLLKPGAKDVGKQRPMPRRASIPKRVVKTVSLTSEPNSQQPRPPWRATNLAPKDLDSMPRLRQPKKTSNDRSPVTALYTEQRLRLSPSPVGNGLGNTRGDETSTDRHSRNPSVPIQLRSNAYVDNGKLCITLKGPSRALPDINAVGNAGDKLRQDSVPMDVRIMFIRDDRTSKQRLKLPPLGAVRRRPKYYSPSPDRNILESRAAHAPFNTRMDPQPKVPGGKTIRKEKLSRGPDDCGSCFSIKNL